MVRSFLLSDQAYRKAYRAKVIVFDVGSVHRFSIRHGKTMLWRRYPSPRASCESETRGSGNETLGPNRRIASLPSPLVFEYALPALGHAAVGRRVGFFERHIDVDLRFQEQGHLDQFSADGRRLNVRPLDPAEYAARVSGSSGGSVKGTVPTSAQMAP